MRYKVLSWLLAVLLLSGCTVAAPTAGTPAPESATLNVFAAASLTEAFTEIGQQFAAEHSGTEVVFNFAGSQQLAQQLAQGAPADVFASANATQMQAAIDAGRIISGTQRTFVRNRLVVVYPQDNPGGLTTLQDLAKEGLSVVLAAKEVPVGQYSLDFLDKASQDATLGAAFKDAVLANVVSYEENVRAVLSKVVLGEADAGIVYTTDIGAAQDEVGQIEIPDALNTIASYPIATVSDSAHPELAQAFVDYVREPSGQQILVKYGFIPTTGSPTGGSPVAGPLAISGLVTNPLTLTVEEVAAMPLVEVKATNRDGVEETYRGVPIRDLLEQAGAESSATEVVFTGGDGYTQTVALADLQGCEDCVIAVLDDGSLRNILPAMAPRYWVRGLIAMEVK